jgi:hypothetical protein
MSRIDYVPRRDADLLVWAQRLFDYATPKATSWKVPAPSGDMSDAIESFDFALQKATAPNSGRVDTMAKNKARAALVRECRTYVQGFLARNPFVTDIDRENMGITVRDTIPTNIPPPLIPVEGELHFPAQAIVEVRNIRPLGGVPVSLSKHGVRIYYGVLGDSDDVDKFRLSARPQTGSDLPHSVFTRRRSRKFVFERDSGREVFFCMRYENAKGETGPWGVMLSAFIP